MMALAQDLTWQGAVTILVPVGVFTFWLIGYSNLRRRGK